MELIFLATMEGYGATEWPLFFGVGSIVSLCLIVWILINKPKKLVKKITCLYCDIKYVDGKYICKNCGKIGRTDTRI